MPGGAYIEMEHISKRFVAVLANDDVSLSADRGDRKSVV